MTAEKNKREELLEFIDKNAFDVILKTKTERFEGKDKENFEGILKKTENEKKKFHNDYKTPEEVKQNFLQNVRSEAAEKVNKDLEKFGLPTLPQLKDEFMELCKKLEV
jgi:hypothetical protein